MNLLNDFGCRVFSDLIMQERLPINTYKSLKKSIDLGQPLESEVATVVASAMKDWAIENGATHYTHWFQPMTGITAGKHDGFISLKKDGSIVLEFSGKELNKGEPDASSFPNGGLRNTFEARGYTVWDCTSPAFIKGKTLYIPTAFCSYNGQALDTKTPLLHSMEVLSKQALRILRLFGNTTAKKVTSSVGAEQEYFLIDRDAYEKRLDLKICGRTLFGTKPPKGQEMDDHYCGRIRLRISKFMTELDDELWKFGIPSKTKHNEVAPAQHEMAPIHESCNVAVDHNQLIMETMRVVAKKNNLACILHEKPFENINGSGKHNNWSLITDEGQNIFDPSDTPYENIQFLIFLCAVIRAVDIHAPLLRMAAASPSNDHRLGGHEAPPAIVSIFLGEHLTSILKNIANGKTNHNDNVSDVLVTNVETLPNLLKDDSDRNRTSPFAFTGNKFEFRMMGASSSISPLNMILNTIVAESLEYFADTLESSKNFDSDIKKIIKETVDNHGRIIFNGNGYTQEWYEYSKKLGLKNIDNCVDAALEFISDETIDMFEKFSVLKREECKARYDIILENYIKTINIEALTLLEMLTRLIIPATIKYCGILAKTYNEVKTIGIKNISIKKDLENLLKLVDETKSLIDKLNTYLDKNDDDLFNLAKHYRDKVLSCMNEIRYRVDKIEPLVDKKIWPIPSITDILYRV